ncbi:MAG: DUF4406 domain-containing protein [Candidatus Levybacteria bacterium]|nr:DUF4406 domain-containing protein [Candidatus Levybacteria bacterium]
MTSDIYQEIKHSTCLKHVHAGLTKVIKEINKNTKMKRLGFVSGILTSEGDKNMPRNIERLRRYTKEIRDTHNFPIFSSVDVFGDGIYDQIEESKFERELREHHFVQFWKMILETGHITDIFMTPKWDKSRGAKIEHEVAQKIKIKIHIVDVVKKIESQVDPAISELTSQSVISKS